MRTKIRRYSKASCLVLLFAAGLPIAGGLFPLLAWILPPVQADQLRDRIKIRWLRTFGRILNLNVDIRGEPVAAPAMVVSNHISWIDIIVLGQYVPGCFAAKSDIAFWPVIGYLSRQAGTIFVRRGDKRQIHQTSENIVWNLRRQSNVLVFPEGTTSTGDGLLAFHASLFQPALLAQAAIQPASIRYMGMANRTAPFIGDDEFVSHLFNMLDLSTIDVQVDFLPALSSNGKTRQMVCAETRSLIENSLNANTGGYRLPFNDLQAGSIG